MYSLILSHNYVQFRLANLMASAATKKIVRHLQMEKNAQRMIVAKQLRIASMCVTSLCGIFFGITNL